MLLQSRHQLEEIAGGKPVVELVHKNPLPGVAAGARRTRQREEIGAASHTSGCAALDRRGPDLLVAEPPEQLPKTRDLLLINTVEGFWCDVSPGNAGAAGLNHHVDLRGRDPCFGWSLNRYFLGAH